MEEKAAALLGASLGLAFLAADFCTQPETFPVFMAWVNSHGTSSSEWTPEKLALLVDNLKDLSALMSEAIIDGVQ